jgi:RNA polymerase sigma-70 factor (ECF subfamily)
MMTTATLSLSAGPASLREALVLLANVQDREKAVDQERSEEESRWIRGAQSGDPKAFGHLVDRYRHQAYEVALRIVRSPEEAEEAAQDAFVKAWRALEGFRQEARFSTWLYRIATRCALDAARKRKRHLGHEVGWEPEAMESVAAPARNGTSGRELLRLERSLGHLSPLRRAVVTLFYLRDQSVDEIATTLDLPAGTVKTHLHRSRAVLRKAWQEYEANDALLEL